MWCVQAALADDKCVVIGLQSTGDARTVEAVAERAVDGELDDFVSGPKVLLSFPPGPLISPQVSQAFCVLVHGHKCGRSMWPITSDARPA